MTITDRPPIKAIPTHYAGHKFRSRTEARWGVFCDSVGRKYSYETQGYRLPNGLTYLPDFYLPEIRTWVEVKGVMDDEDQAKILEFARWRNEPIAVLGDIPEPGSNGPHFHILGKPYQSPVVAIFEAMWVLTQTGVRAEQHGIPTYVLPGDEFPSQGWEFKASPTLSIHPLIDQGYRAAGTARFEHSETPRAKRLDVATSLGDWFHVPGSEMSHYFLAAMDRCLCERAAFAGHLERGTRPDLKDFACELALSRRKQTMLGAGLIAGWDQ